MKKLSYTQRLAISEGIRQNKSNAQIAREIGVHRSTVGREIERNASSREEYAALEANDKSWRRQQAAMPERMMLFGGVDFFTKLRKHDTIYIYYSRTHRNRLSRFQRYESYFRGINDSISEAGNQKADFGSQKSDVFTGSRMSVSEIDFTFQSKKEIFILPLIIFTHDYSFSFDPLFIVWSQNAESRNNFQNFIFSSLKCFDHLSQAG